MTFRIIFYRATNVLVSLFLVASLLFTHYYIYANITHIIEPQELQGEKVVATVQY